MPCEASSSPLMAVTVIGTSCKRSATRLAVTTTSANSSVAVAPEAELSTTAAAHPGVGIAAQHANAAKYLRADVLFIADSRCSSPICVWIEIRNGFHSDG